MRPTESPVCASVAAAARPPLHHVLQSFELVLQDAPKKQQPQQDPQLTWDFARTNLLLASQLAVHRCQLYEAVKFHGQQQAQRRSDTLLNRDLRGAEAGVCVCVFACVCVRACVVWWWALARGLGCKALVTSDLPGPAVVCSQLFLGCSRACVAPLWQGLLGAWNLYRRQHRA
jgi:hypothetical protein